MADTTHSRQPILPAHSGQSSPNDASSEPAADTTNPERSIQPIDMRHLLKTVAVALGLTVLFMTPQFLIHIPTGIIAPISAGYMTGGLMRVTGQVALILGVIFFLVVGLPAPLGYHLFGWFNHLPFVAIAVFSGVVATYYGCLITIMSWVGGGGLQRH